MVFLYVPLGMTFFTKVSWQYNELAFYFPQCILLKNTIWSYSTTHFDWGSISGKLYSRLHQANNNT